MMNTHLLFVLLCLCALIDCAPVHFTLRRSPQAAKALARRFARDNGDQVPLSGSIDAYGEFFAKIGLGSPTQTFEVQIDTGSSDLLLYAAGCSGCGSNVQEYQIGQSKTAKRVPCKDPSFKCQCSGANCTFDDQYGDGSEVKGFVVQDIITVGDSPLKANVSFGAIEQSSPNFEPTNVDGIWGLAYQDLSDWQGATVFQNLVSQLGISNVFSMCLTPQNPSFTLGQTFSDSSIQWTPITQELYYVVEVKDVAVNGQSIGVNPSVYNENLSIVDSGTTLFYLTSKAFSAFQSAFQSMCSQTKLVGVCGGGNQTLFSGYCFSMTSDDRKAFPSVSVTLDGTNSLTIGPDQYLVEQSGDYCLGIQNGGDQTGVILGDVFMQNWNVIFDRANKRVGFADLSTCP